MTAMNKLNYLPMNDECPWEKRNDQNSSELKSLFFKWNLLPDLILKSFRATSQLQKKEESAAIEKMFTDVNVLSSIGLSKPPDGHAVEVKVKPLSCTVLNMKFFDKLIDADIVSDTGYIRGCYEEEIDGILVQDKLRLMCSKDNIGEYTLGSRDRNEFIFHLLKLLCIGGSKCQCEDRFHALKSAIKTLYKVLIEVRKAEPGVTEIVSSVYEVDIQGDSSKFYPVPDNVHNKCYVIVTGQKVTMLLKKFVPFW